LIEGLRYLPELQARRDKQTEDGIPPDFLDCESCLVAATEQERRCLGCGLMPKHLHLPGMRPFSEASVCPGYSASMPEVYEAARAMSWSKRGGLVPLYGAVELPPVATEAIDVLEGAANTVERRILREAREDIGGARGHS
jgi:hypothetical protein